MIVQVVLGTQLRGKLEVIAQTLPFLNDLERLAEAGWLQDIHMILGVIVGLSTLVVALLLLKTAGQEMILVRQLSFLLISMAAFQLVLGFAFLFAGLVPLVQLFHLWIPTVMIGILMVLLAAVSGFGMALDYSLRSIAKPLVWGVVVTVILLGVAAFVVSQAEKSFGQGIAEIAPAPVEMDHCA
jgi:hypothetical protein